MSMMCSVLGLSPAQVKALRATPSLATEVAMAAEGIGSGNLGPFGSLQEPIELEKSWHMLHYLFTGSIDETSSPGGALMGGEELGEDIGYGPVRLHGEKATAEFARFLAGLDVAGLQARLDPAEMERVGIYATAADEDEELSEEIALFFPQLRDYVAEVAQKQGGLLIWLI